MRSDTGGGRRLVEARLSAFGAAPTRVLMTVEDLSPLARLRRGALRIIACPRCHTNVTLRVGDGIAGETAPMEARRPS